MRYGASKNLSPNVEAPRQILPARLFQSFPDQSAVFPAVKLEQGPLQAFFPFAGHMDAFAAARVNAGAVHGRGKGAGSGVKVLNLVGHKAALF